MTTADDRPQAKVERAARARRRALKAADVATRELAILARDLVYRDDNYDGVMSAADFSRFAEVPQSTVKRWIESSG